MMVMVMVAAGVLVDVEKMKKDKFMSKFVILLSG